MQPRRFVVCASVLGAFGVAAGEAHAGLSITPTRDAMTLVNRLVATGITVVKATYTGGSVINPMSGYASSEAAGLYSGGPLNIRD